MQDVWVDAMRTWSRDGPPDNPVGWIVATARRRAHRSNASWAATGPTGHDRRRWPAERADPGPRLGRGRRHSRRAPSADLHLLPSGDRSEVSRAPSTLRTVAGLTTREIARAFSTSESTMQQRIVRTKQRISTAGIPYRVPEADELPERLKSVHSVIYAIFAEGYAATEHPDFLRVDLVDEAIRLAELVCTLLPADEPESLGLLALSSSTMPAARAGSTPTGRWYSSKTKNARPGITSSSTAASCCSIGQGPTAPRGRSSSRRPSRPSMPRRRRWKRPTGPKSPASTQPCSQSGRHRRLESPTPSPSAWRSDRTQVSTCSIDSPTTTTATADCSPPPRSRTPPPTSAGNRLAELGARGSTRPHRVAGRSGSRPRGRTEHPTANGTCPSGMAAEYLFARPQPATSRDATSSTLQGAAALWVRVAPPTLGNVGIAAIATRNSGVLQTIC